jgi:hypothetical protein
MPKEGYNFSHWEGNGIIADTLNPVFLDTLTASTLTFRAWFEEWAVDLNDQTGRTSLTLWPNPATSALTLKSQKPFAKGSEFRILDLNGRTVSENVLPAGQTTAPINISHLRPSVYILLIVQPGQQDEHLRFVKAN